MSASHTLTRFRLLAPVILLLCVQSNAASWEVNWICELSR
jgi:hypothetical protein